MVSTGPSVITIRPFEEKDLDATLGLIRACYGDEAADPMLWRHSHFGHPGAVSGTMVACAGTMLVGIQPMEVYPFYLAREPLSGAVLTGVMVHPEWRRRGVFLRLLEACEEQAWKLGASFVVTMPNDRSRPGFLKRGYIDPAERSLMVLPLTAVQKKGVAPILCGLAARVTPAASRLRRAHRDGVTEVGRFGPGVEPMIEDVARGWFGLIQRRDRDWLAWRYPETSPHGYRRWVANGRGGSCRAIAVTAQGVQRGMELGFLVDMIAIDVDSAAAVCGAACRALQEQGLPLIISVVSCRWCREVLARVGFLRVPRPMAVKRFYTVYRPAPGEEERLTQLNNIENWYQTLGDWDTV